MLQLAITLNILFYLFIFLRFATISIDYYCLVHELEEYYNQKISHYTCWIHKPIRVFNDNFWYHNESNFFMSQDNYKILLKLRSLEFVREYDKAEFGE